MLKESTQPSDIGVIIGRFQVEHLTKGHLHLIRSVIEKKHRAILIFIGTSVLPFSDKDPLSYVAREAMLREELDNLIGLNFYILPLPDNRSDRKWSEYLDHCIRQHFPFNSVTLYGGRDCFISHYYGDFPFEAIESIESVSGTEVRMAVGKNHGKTRDFRCGVIYATQNRYPICYPTVDVAIVRQNVADYEVLLGRKADQTEWRFIGGFAAPEDLSFEDSARREVIEETGLEVGDITYLGSFFVDDWRYRNVKDKIKTLFFKATYVFGIPNAGDDIVEVRWFKVDSLEYKLVSEHVKLMDLLQKNLKH